MKNDVVGRVRTRAKQFPVTLVTEFLTIGPSLKIGYPSYFVYNSKLGIFATERVVLP